MDHQYMCKSQALRPSTSLGQILRYLFNYCCNSFYKCHLCTSHFYPLLPRLRGWAGIMIFTFQSPGISPPCGDKLMVTTLLFAPPYATENPSMVSQCYNPHTSPALRGQSKSNCTAPYPGYSTAIAVGGGSGYK